MKLTQAKSLPYPVLSSFGDDITPAGYDLEVSLEGDGDRWMLSGVVRYDNDTIRGMVERGSFLHGVHVECARTFHRSWHVVDADSVSFEVPFGELYGEVQVSAFCVADKGVATYGNSGQHADYGARTFKIDPGSIVAYAPTCICQAYTDVDPIQRISSILNVARDRERRSGPLSISFSENRIIATIGDGDYEDYVRVRSDPRVRGLLASNVVFPVILQVVLMLREMNEVDLDEMRASHRWCRSLLAKFESENIDIRAKDQLDLFERIQALLLHPVHRGIRDLYEQFNEEK